MKRLAWALLALTLTACAGEEKAGEKKLNIYIWTNYLPDDVLADFERRTGIDATVDTYDSNEIVLEKLQSGMADYDIVVPSGSRSPLEGLPGTGGVVRTSTPVIRPPSIRKPVTWVCP